MKKILTAVSLCVLSMTAMATVRGESGQTIPKTDPSSPPQSNVQVGAAAAATSSSHSAASALSGSLSLSANQNQNGSSATGTSGVESSNKVYVAPAPVQAANVPISTADCVTTSSKAVALGWSLISWGQSEQVVNKTCAKKQLVTSLIQTCQFLTAARVQKSLVEEVAPELAELIEVDATTKNYPLGSCVNGVPQKP